MSGTDAGPAGIRLEAIAKSFDGETRVVDAVSLDIAPGEFFSLLGPSGCGKTTTLRMIAGFETVDAGRILVGSRDMTDVPAHKRDMGMVFQSYALFPHRTVAENVAFGLRMRGVGRAEIAERVRGALDLVALSRFADRRPNQLSGGQQQRVALARALVIRPLVLLCDEPLGALDRKLRQQMQVELKHLQQRLGVTLLFVTHDQEEALAMSDRMAVMRAGRIEQIGTPAEIYDRPRTRFVADFIGEINLLAQPDGRTLALRPEKVVLGAPTVSPKGLIESASFLGGATLYRVKTDDGRLLLAKETNTVDHPARRFGDEVGLSWHPGDAVALES
jgi:ABC-type Fe3+/spermidine/putrescine transport system ATPase subunit